MAEAVDRLPSLKGLQWGRDVSIPEMTKMVRLQSIWDCFNGAGMFPSQKFAALQRSDFLANGFNGAGMFPSQKCRRRRFVWRRPPRFNGAGMFPSQKCG